jgi:hypothetical protein
MRGEIPLWHLGFEGLCLRVVTKKLVVEEATDTLFVDCKCLHGKLHSVKGGRFPDIVDREVVGAFGGNGGLLAFT